MEIAGNLRRTIRRHPRRWGTALIVAAALIAFGLYWFAPWNLVIDRRVDEAVPVAGASGPAGEGGEATGGVVDDPTGGGVVDDPGAGAGPVTLAGGDFQGLEHATAGTALIVELEDGSRFLRLEDLDTTNGPDLRVVVTDQPPSDDWHVWDDGELVDLGPLKGNIGSSNYEIPPDLDLARFRTAVIWCRRFSVGFGVAPLVRPES